MAGFRAIATGIYWGLASALIFAGGPTAVEAAEVVEVEGVAAIVKDDVAQARDRAIDDAKRKAVEQVAGTRIQAESVTRHYRMVEDRIYSRASGFIARYRILSELREQNVYRVRIEASVDDRALVEDLSLVMKTRPRVIVMIAEQNVGRSGFSYWWGKGHVADLDILQTALVEAWQPRGFKFVDPALLQDKLAKSSALTQPSLTNQAAVAIGRSADADVAIVGKVLVSDGGPVMKGVDMRTFNAVGTLRILNVDTGEIIAVADRAATAAHVDGNLGGRAAIRALANKLTDDLERRIVTRWTAEAAGTRRLEVVVEGVRGARMARALARGIRQQVRGVESVRVRRRDRKTAYLSVRLQGTARDFGHDLESKRFGGVRLRTVSVSGAKLVAQVSP